MIKIETGFIAKLLAALALLLVSTGAAHAQWEDYQYEAFDSTETIFPTGPIGEATASVDAQGRYVIDGMNTGKDSLSAIRDNVSFYRISADCQILSSTAGELAFCGLLFHYGKRPGSDLPSYYVFYAYGDGFYGVKRIVDGGKSDIIVPLSATELLVGGEANTLAVEARGNRFELFINGESVNTFTDVKLDGGGYGVYISKFSIAAFDNFEVQLEPAPVRSQADEARNEPKRGVKPLDIPRNPDRPLYPWEVGYDKDPKKKKRRLDSERRGDSGDSRGADQAKRPQSKPAARKVARRDDDLERDTTSRRGDKSFIADELPREAELAQIELKQAKRGTSIREQYKQQTEPEPSEPEAIPEELEAEVVPEPDPEVIAQAEPAPSSEPVEPVELMDEAATDTGKALPEEPTEEGDLLYRRAPGFDEGAEAEPKPVVAEAPEEDEEPQPAAADQPRKRGLRIGEDDWDAPRTAYVPKRRLPPAEREKEEPAAEETPREPAKAIASSGEEVAVETLPLDGAPLRDPELESESETSPEEPEPAAAAPAINEPEAVAPTDSEPSPEPTRAEAGLPEPMAVPEPQPALSESERALDLELPAPSEPQEPEIPGLETVTISDDFTTQQVWQTQDLPTSNYKYADGGYAIDNRNAQTMAISYQQDTLRDVNIAVDALHSGGADYVGYGVAGRFVLEQDASGRPQISYYGLFISRSGEYMLLKVVRGAETVLRDWATSPLINLGGLNNVELRIEGATIIALINGQQAATLSDGDIASGGYALLAGPGIAAQFDNLSLTGVRE